MVRGHLRRRSEVTRKTPPARWGFCWVEGADAGGLREVGVGVRGETAGQGSGFEAGG